MKTNLIHQTSLLLLIIAALGTSCQKDDKQVKIMSHQFAWTGKNNASGGNYSTFSLKLIMCDRERKLNEGSTWVENVGSQATNSYGLGKQENNVISVTGILGYGGPSSSNTVIPYRVYIKLKDGTETNEISFDAIRQPGAN